MRRFRSVAAQKAPDGKPLRLYLLQAESSLSAPLLAPPPLRAGETIKLNQIPIKLATDSIGSPIYKAAYEKLASERKGESRRVGGAKIYCRVS